MKSQYEQASAPNPSRIAILTGCLEPGQDGVGDYTSGLAEQSSLAGVPVLAIALNDHWINSVTKVQRNGVKVLRLPPGISATDQHRHVRSALDEFDADWLSLQFVPYSYHRRGWVHGLSRRIKPLLERSEALAGELNTRPLHIMFHELWLGALSQSSLKHRMEGLWQRQGILRFINALRPAVVHTTNLTYARMLQDRGVPARVLPLFGSIPLEPNVAVQREHDRWWQGELESMRLTAKARKEWWIFGVFGSIHPEWWPGDLFNALLAIPAGDRRKIAMLTVGRSGTVGSKVIRRLEREFAGRVEIRELGEQSTGRVAAIFRHLDFGIATTPWDLIGKSSSAMAMREHGLPVIVTRSQEAHSAPASDQSFADPLLLKYDSTLAARLMCIEHASPKLRRSRVVQEWLDELHRWNQPLPRSYSQSKDSCCS